MRYIYSFLNLLFIISCRETPESISQTGILIDSLRIHSDTKLCDTCSSYLTIGHDECTECSDLKTISGTLYIPNYIYKRYNSIIKTDSFYLKKLKKHDLVFLNMNDLKLSNGAIFTKLWPDTVTWRDFHKRYNVVGKVVDLDVKKGKGKINVLLKFRIDKFDLIQPLPAEDIAKAGTTM